MSGLLIDAYQYKSTVLRDDDPLNLPTKENILNTLRELMDNSHNYSEIWFHYSGHGYDDSLIVPCDYVSQGVITDIDFFNIIKDVKCPIRLIFDSSQLYNISVNLPKINQLVIILYRTSSDKITDNLIYLLRTNNYFIKYNDIINNIPNIEIFTNQQVNYNSIFINYLYYNYKLLYDTVMNMNKIVITSPQQITESETNVNKLNIKKRIIQAKHK